MKICEKIGWLYVVRWHVLKNTTTRFDIYSRYHFVWVVFAIIYINKKQKQNINNGLRS